MGLLKVKGLSLLLSVVLIFNLFFTCCGVLFVFALLLSWLFFFGYGMDEVMMY